MKSSRKCSNKKEQRKPKVVLVCRTGLSGVPPDSVRCTREPNSKLATFGNSGRSLRYNSPDCPVCQAEQRSSAPTIVCNATVKRYIARLRAQKSEQALKAHQTVNIDCLVHHRTVRWPRSQKLQWSEPNGLVMWLAHRTVSGGAPDCPVRHTTEALTNGSFGGWGYKYPPTTTLQGIQVSRHRTLYMSSRVHSKTQTKRSNPLPSPKIIPIK
jgi:hypothetical protein